MRKVAFWALAWMFKHTLYWWERMLVILALATPEVIELGSGLAACSYGWALLWGAGLFQDYAEVYRPMTFLPQPVWGLIVLAFGVLQITAMPSKARLARRKSALLGTVLWAFLATMYFKGDHRAPLVGFFVLGATSNAWVYLRIGNRWQADGED